FMRVLEIEIQRLLGRKALVFAYGYAVARYPLHGRTHGCPRINGRIGRIRTPRQADTELNQARRAIERANIFFFDVAQITIAAHENKSRLRHHSQAQRRNLLDRFPGNNAPVLDTVAVARTRSRECRQREGEFYSRDTMNRYGTLTSPCHFDLPCHTLNSRQACIVEQYLYWPYDVLRCSRKLSPAHQHHPLRQCSGSYFLGDVRRRCRIVCHACISDGGDTKRRHLSSNRAQGRRRSLEASVEPCIAAPYPPSGRFVFVSLNTFRPVCAIKNLVERSGIQQPKSSALVLHSYGVVRRQPVERRAIQRPIRAFMIASDP